MTDAPRAAAAHGPHPACSTEEGIVAQNDTSSCYSIVGSFGTRDLDGTRRGPRRASSDEHWRYKQHWEIRFQQLKLHPTLIAITAGNAADLKSPMLGMLWS
jgi:hypothetical protein